MVTTGFAPGVGTCVGECTVEPGKRALMKEMIWLSTDPALTWLMPQGCWLLGLTISPSDLNSLPGIDLPAASGLTAVPGQFIPAALLPFVAVLRAALLLFKQSLRVRRLQMAVKRLRWYHLLLHVCGLALLWFAILYLQMLSTVTLP